MKRRSYCYRTGCLLSGLLIVLGGCVTKDAPVDNVERNNLDAMTTGDVHIKDHRFRVWVADDFETRQLGLMNVGEDELGPLPEGGHRGMLFIFPFEQPLSFWMKNTITPLDIAFIRDDGIIIKTYSMAPLETRQYPSVEPARFALEVKAGTFADLGIAAGDRVEIPDSLLKTTP